MRRIRRRPDFSWNKMRPGKTYQSKCAAGWIFLTKSTWVLCPVNAVKKIFSTNLSSESSSFD